MPVIERVVVVVRTSGPGPIGRLARVQPCEIPVRSLATDLALAYMFWEQQKATSEDLIDVAVAALQSGTESSGLSELAGLSPSQATSEAPFLLEAALKELSVTRLDERTGRLRIAQMHARRLLSDEITTYDGARCIWRSFLPGRPEFAAVFLLAEDEYEHGGVHDDSNIDRRVVQAAYDILALDDW